MGTTRQHARQNTDYECLSLRARILAATIVTLVMGGAGLALAAVHPNALPDTRTACSAICSK